MTPTLKDYEVRIWYSPDPGDECYIAQVLDMPAITAHGESRQEAAAEIDTALELALQAFAEDQDIPPAPGSRAAAELGRLGGLAKSESKVAAARANGAKGGRPSKNLDDRIRNKSGDTRLDLRRKETGSASISAYRTNATIGQISKVQARLWRSSVNRFRPLPACQECN